VKGTDYQAALEPSEFKGFVENIKTAYSALGTMALLPLNESDLNYRTFQKKSIVAAHELQRGEVLNRKDVHFLRNSSNGLSPNQFSQLEGKQLTRNIKAYDNIAWKDIE
jgi:sialic acid synthase SpsE